MFVTSDSRKGTFQPVCSGRVFGNMKYSFPSLLSGNVHIYLPDFFCDTYDWFRDIGSSIGNYPLPIACDGGWRESRGTKIKGADHQNQGLFLI